MLLSGDIKVPSHDRLCKVLECAGNIVVDVIAVANDSNNNGLEERDDPGDEEGDVVHHEPKVVLQGAHDG